MIHRKGNLLSNTEGIIVHGCNAQGAMNSGVAKEIRSLYPQVYAEYKKESEYFLGNVTIIRVTETLFVANAITQEFYGKDKNFRYVSYDAISVCFKQIYEFASQGMFDIHIPKIGAGLGNGCWEAIEKIIDHEMQDLNVICWSLDD